MCRQAFRECWRRIRQTWPGWERISQICVPLALLVTYFEYDRNRSKEGLDSALGIYRELDHAYTEYVKLCLEHPQLDCYVKSQADTLTKPLDEKERIQQMILYDMLTDVFETAYVHFVKFRGRYHSQEALDLFDSQWESWEGYIIKFLQRPTYLAVWFEVNDGYDDGLRCHVRYLMMQPPEPPDQKKLYDRILLLIDDKLRARLETWLVEMKRVEAKQKKMNKECD